MLDNGQVRFLDQSKVGNLADFGLCKTRPGPKSLAAPTRTANQSIPPSSPQSLDPRPRRRLNRDMKSRLFFALMAGCWEHTQMKALGRFHKPL